MTDTWTWATVTQATPLRIKVDGDTSALDATTDNLVGSLAVDDRVRVHLHADGIIVTGLQGGGTAEATAATANTLALRNGSGQLKAADGVAADDVVTVGQMSAGDNTGFIAITSFETGFSADSTQPPGIRIQNGRCYLEGRINGEAVAGASDRLAFLPSSTSDFWPNATMYWPSVVDSANDRPGQYRVNSSGHVRIHNGPNGTATDFHLDNVSWWAP